MTKINLEFTSWEEVIKFASDLVQDQEGIIAVDAAKVQQVLIEQTAPIQAPTQQATPIQTSVYQAAPVQAPVQQPAPVQQSVPTAVLTTPPEYTQDEIASAAMQVMDKGGQVQLQELLAAYGVETLPQLPKEQYGNFATALRGMGAQI